VLDYLSPLLPFDGVDHFTHVLGEIAEVFQSRTGALSVAMAGDVLRILVAKRTDELLALPDRAYVFRVSPAEEIAPYSQAIQDLYAESLVRAGISQADIRWTASRDAIGMAAMRLAPYALLSLPAHAFANAFWRVFRLAFSQDAGVFITPPAVAELVGRMLRPIPGERIIDPACGSGALLLEAARQADAWLAENDPSSRASQLRPYLDVSGVEINAAVAEIARNNMLLAGLPADRTFAADALVDEVLAERGIKADSYDAVLSNPPFGRVVSSFHRRAHADAASRERRIDVGALFVERALSLVRPSGRIALIVPESFLALPTLEHMRAWLLERASLKAIISLPAEAFAPSGVYLKTSLLVLEKHPGRGDDPVFVADLRDLGYDRMGRTISQSGVPKLLAEFRRFLDHPGEGTGRVEVISEDAGFRAWRVSSSSIRSERMDVPHLARWEHEGVESLASISFPLVSLRKVVRVISGQHIRADPGLEAGYEDEVLVIQAGVVRELYLDLERAPAMKARSNQLQPRSFIQDGDVLVTTTGYYLGRAAVAENLPRRAVASSAVTILRPTPEIHPYYLAAILNSPIGKQQIASRQAAATAQPYIRRSDLGEVQIPVPPLETQKALADQLMTMRMEADGLINRAREIREASVAHIINALIAGDYA
jgi:tRNA1(Val) A37 N6-methylase TrmN6